jgi:aspartate kinase
MARYILKFGGTSVGSIERIEHVARIIQKRYEEGHDIVVVVSAMSGVTNSLVDYARSISPDLINYEYDVIVSSGEQITAGLLALCLQKINVPSRSYLAWQIPITTDTLSTSARITQIPVHNIEASLNERVIPVVAGFQGVSREGRLTTLGRGGSDTTAVALAAALKAERCDIYTDVDGIYTADPRLVPHAKKLDVISYAEIFEMASQGAKVLQARCVELAMKHNVKYKFYHPLMREKVPTLWVKTS